jgi:hypothetical protein
MYGQKAMAKSNSVALVPDLAIVWGAQSVSSVGNSDLFRIFHWTLSGLSCSAFSKPRSSTY